MSHIIGNASDFYRLRVIHLDEGDSPEMEWREDILYRRAASEAPPEYDQWRVEAVEVDDEEAVTLIEAFETAEVAERLRAIVAEDLGQMTKSEFERTYLTGADAGAAG